MNDHGLSEKQLQLIKEIILEHAPAVESVHLFGSRASGSYKNYSDIDLVLYGKLDEQTADRLWTCFHESSLPYKVDISTYHLVNYPPLKERIDRFSVPLFSEQQLKKSAQEDSGNS